MRVPAVLTMVTGLALAAAGCRSPFGPQYEYEEQLYLRVDGAATVVVDASIPALIALRGIALDPSASATVDRNALRALLDTAGCKVDNVGQPWRRKGRRFVQVRLSTPDVRALTHCTLLAWSSYEIDRLPEGIHYRQTVGAPTALDPGKVNWDGSELVAFKLHLPSRVRDHNVRRLEDNEPGGLERGNILTWEQRLSDRRAGKPIEVDVKMDSASILYTTLWLFGGAFVGAVIALTLVVWLIVRRGRKAAAARPS